jgi:hypothetical protein
MIQSALFGTLAVFQADPVDSFSQDDVIEQIIQLEHHTSFKTLCRDVWALFFRVLPPYPKYMPGLYAIGNPGMDTPVLVTGNYDVTVRRVIKQIDGVIDVWLLVVDSAGINVWCGAGGGFLTAERILGGLTMSGVDDWHTSKLLVLPQLCANGVDGNTIREQSDWNIRWGPVRASDIAPFLQGGLRKTDAMRTISFPLIDRLEMVSATLGLYALMILIPILIFWPHLFWPTFITLFGLSYFYALTLPLLPGRDGLAKSLSLVLIALLGLLTYSWLTGFPEPLYLFRRSLGVTALSVFVAAEMQGMSPLMRGEQANWGWEAVIAVVLGATYWLVPNLVGWSN